MYKIWKLKQVEYNQKLASRLHGYVMLVTAAHRRQWMIIWWCTISDHSIHQFFQFLVSIVQTECTYQVLFLHPCWEKGYYSIYLPSSCLRFPSHNSSYVQLSNIIQVLRDVRGWVVNIIVTSVLEFGMYTSWLHKAIIRTPPGCIITLWHKENCAA